MVMRCTPYGQRAHTAPGREQLAAKGRTETLGLRRARLVAATKVWVEG